jgi:iron complex transport system substrate-binding protein
MLRVHPSVRRATAVLALVPLLAVAAACGSDDDSASDTASTGTSTPGEAMPGTSAADTAVDATEPPASADAATDTSTEGSEPQADGATRTVEHALGTSEVPVDPQRIVVVDRRGSLAFLLELGLEPVGALEATWLFGEPFHPLIAEQAESAGVEPIDGTDGPNLEQIATLQPDLIIGNVRDMAETSDELAQIAPTVGLEWNFADPLANAVTIGDAVGRGEEAQALVDDFDASLDAAAADTADPGTVSILGLFAVDDIRIYREHNLYGVLTERLGGEIVPTESELAFDPEDNEVNFVSLEEIGMARGDRAISFVNLASEADAAYRALESEALVQALPAFQAGQVLEADPQLAFGAAGTTGINAMLEQLVEFYNS